MHLWATDLCAILRRILAQKQGTGYDTHISEIQRGNSVLVVWSQTPITPRVELYTRSYIKLSHYVCAWTYLCATEVALATISLRLGEKLSMCGALLMTCLPFIHRNLISTPTNVKRRIWASKTHDTVHTHDNRAKCLKKLNDSLWYVKV